MTNLFARQRVKKNDSNHPIYHSFFSFEKGCPTTTFELNGWGDDLVHDYLKAIEVDGRIGRFVRKATRIMAVNGTMISGTKDFLVKTTPNLA